MSSADFDFCGQSTATLPPSELPITRNVPIKMELKRVAGIADPVAGRRSAMGVRLR